MGPARMDGAISVADPSVLQATVEQLFEQIQDTLPERPWHEIDVENDVPWNALEKILWSATTAFGKMICWWPSRLCLPLCKMLCLT